MLIKRSPGKSLLAAPKDSSPLILHPFLARCPTPSPKVRLLARIAQLVLNWTYTEHMAPHSGIFADDSSKYRGE